MALTTPTRPTERVPLRVAVRRDDWWLKPLLTVLGLGAFVIYATFRAFENHHFHYPPYLSPFYSPELPIHLNIGGWVVPNSLYILVFPLSFRVTCYYYRQAYYRAFFGDPPACAVPEPAFRRSYNGERAFPLVLQNVHRYAMYAALVFLIFLGYDAVHAFFFADGFHVNIGSLILLGNWVLLTGYTLGCHSFRHMVGGKHDCYTCPLNNATMSEPSAQYKGWRLSTVLNMNHMQWAWTSLIGVCVTDLYIRSVSAGLIPDVRFF